jgi:phosphate transport system protein
MSNRLRFEIEKLKKRLLAISALVEEGVQQAVQAVQERDETRAKVVITADSEIDMREVDLEEECLKVLALYQPVASDLRFIITVMKINNDLERIGDLAVDIAERAYYLSTHAPVVSPFDVVSMADTTREMLRKCLDALINLDATIAKEVPALDTHVDDINRQMYSLVSDAIRRNPDQMETYLQLLSVSRYLERIADHATSISEDVLYMLYGEIVRHQTGSNSDHERLTP